MRQWLKELWLTLYWKRLGFIKRLKEKYIDWIHRRKPQKYCWADSVRWAVSSTEFNPCKIDRSDECRKCEICYCGAWEKGEFVADKERERPEVSEDAPPF